MPLPDPGPDADPDEEMAMGEVDFLAVQDLCPRAPSRPGSPTVLG
jgi:hypothetical protein